MSASQTQSHSLHLHSCTGHNHHRALCLILSTLFYSHYPCQRRRDRLFFLDCFLPFFSFFLFILLFFCSLTFSHLTLSHSLFLSTTTTINTERPTIVQCDLLSRSFSLSPRVHQHCRQCQCQLTHRHTRKRDTFCRAINGENGTSGGGQQLNWKQLL